MGREVTEYSRDLSKIMLRSVVGADIGLYLQNDAMGQDGDHLGMDGPLHQITTEPGGEYERLTLKTGVNPDFDVTGWTGVVDHLFAADDGGFILAVPLLDRAQPVKVGGEATSVTVNVWGPEE